VSLAVALYRDHTARQRLIDARPLLIAGHCSTDEHGFADAMLDLRTTVAQAADVYYAPGWPWLVVSDGIDTIFEGRVEDRRLTAEGVSVTAFGLWRALGDVEVSTELTQTVTYYDWHVVPASELPNRYPDRFFVGLAANGRTGIQPVSGTVHGSNIFGSFGWTIPGRSEYVLSKVVVTGSARLDTTWTARVDLANPAQQLSAIYLQTNSGGAQQTYPVNVTATPAAADDRVSIYVSLTKSAAPAMQADPNSFFEVAVTATYRLRAGSTVSQQAVRYAAAHAGGGLSNNVLQVFMPAGAGVPTTFVDTTAADVLRTLAYSVAPAWRYGVWDGQAAVLATPDRVGRSYLADLDTLAVGRTVGDLATVVTATWRDPQTGETRRTLPAEDAAATARYGRREVVIDSKRQFENEANAYRDAYLAAHSHPQTRAEATIARLYTLSGQPMPVHLLRAHDTITVRNLSNALAAHEPTVVRLQLTRATLDLVSGAMEVEPDLPAPTVETLLAQGVLR
jgi:hypothetical protein